MAGVGGIMAGVISAASITVPSGGHYRFQTRPRIKLCASIPTAKGQFPYQKGTVSEIDYLLVLLL
jgi:hypothetical protein